MSKKTLVAMLFLVCLAGFFSPIFAADVRRPVGEIGSVELAQFFDQAQLVDCRSRLEYDVLRMKNAVHIPEITMVREDLQRLRSNDPAKPIVFYCNGED